MARSRSRIAILGALACTALVAACGGGSGGGDSTSGGGKTVISFWARPENPSVGIAKMFNDQSKDVEVKVTTIPDAQYATKLGAAVRGSSAPDVADIDDINTSLFAATGVAKDITAFVDKLAFKSQLNAAQMNLGTLNGKIYGVPYINGSSILIYNKGLFKKAGLDPSKPPATWAELEQDAKKITALGGGVHGYDIPGACGGCLVYTVYPLIWASGGQVFSQFGPKQTTTYANGPQTAAALEMYRRLWTSGSVAATGQSQNGSTWGSDFQAGKVGIILGTPVWIPPAKKAGVDVGVGVLPGQQGGYSTFVGGDTLIQLAKSNKDAAVQEFITFALQPKAQEYISSDWFLGPVRNDLLTADFTKKYPEVAVLLKGSQKGDVPKVIGFTAATEDPNSPWVTAFQKIVFAGADPASTLAAADRASGKLLQQAYQQQVGG